ncbi:MAG: hypothetical protein K2M36_03990, partial [Clostridia bacterium]|nr:hypothetical protein [Clostridia bacterium]
GIQKRKTTIIVLVTVLAILLSSAVLLVVPQNSASALDTANISNIVKAGNFEELWNSSTSTFNTKVLDDIYDKCFGNEDPIQYIKNNGADDYNTYGKNSPCAEAGIPYYVVPATVLNAKVGNTTNGMVVKLNDWNWSAASLTLDKDDNVILTLLLVNGMSSAQQSPSGTPTKTNTIYTSNGYHKHLLNNTMWSLFQASSEFAQNYLVQPKNIQYQRTQTMYGRISGAYNQPCDALLSLTDGWASGSQRWTYQPDENINGMRYDAWGEDYIWSPSLTEMGSTAIAQPQSIWKLTYEQIKCGGSSTNYCGLRSSFVNFNIAGSGSFGWIHVMNKTGGLSTTSTGTYSLRPAIHLNLTAASLATKGTEIENPENITTTYNNDAQTVKSAYTAKPTDVSWYNSTYYEHTDNYVNITYYNKQNVSIANVKEAGEYWVKVEIMQAWADAADTATASVAPKYGWTTAQTETAKALRRPKFKGTADTSDTAHIESDTVRWFRFIIKPKELTVNKPAYNASTQVLTPPTFAVSSELYADAPALATKITGTAADGTTVNLINTLPTKRGNYTAQAILVKSSTDTTAYDGGNYVIKDEANIKCDVVINYLKLTILNIATTTQTYTGSDIKFPLPAAYD